MAAKLISEGKKQLQMSTVYFDSIDDTPSTVVAGKEYEIARKRIPRGVAYTLGYAPAGTRLFRADIQKLSAGGDSNGLLRVYKVSPDGTAIQQKVVEADSDSLRAGVGSSFDLTKVVDLGKEPANLFKSDYLLVLNWVPTATTDNVDVSACTLQLDVTEHVFAV